MTDRLSLPPRQLARAVAAVALSGGVGTLLRDLILKVDTTSLYAHLTGTTGWATHVPWTLTAINVVGIFLATWALQAPLAHREPNDIKRLLVITGFLGGFTSYSSFIAAMGALWHVTVLGSVVATASILLAGVAAAWLGLKAAK